MNIIYTDLHHRRNPKTELSGGELVTPHESPQRAEIILNRARERNIGAIIAPNTYPLTLPETIHTTDYVRFIADCWNDWQAAGYKGEAIATCWPSRAMPRLRIPAEIDGRIGYYALAAETAISDGTYEAAQAAAAAAATAADLLTSGERAAFALCRPPGHHAATDMFGGYCFFNNAAIAAQRLLNAGATRIAILDIDFHHGNGTQQIFYERDDVLFISLHGDPTHAFPYYLGHPDETGKSAGAGHNLNLPLPPGTAYPAWREALQRGLERISAAAPDHLIISLGVDTYKNDPISFFKLESDDFAATGEMIAELGIPTAFIMEGGYAVEEIGINTINTLEGYQERQPS